MKKHTLYKAFLLGSFALTLSCTDLEVKEKDSFVIENAEGNFAGVSPASAVTSSYADLRGFADQANLYALLEVTSDELVVPTRGTDWGDNGVWRTLHQHTWTPSHQYILAAWNQLNSNVFRLNQLLAPESNASAQQAAEGKFLRAFNMFYVLDLFRQIPFRGVNDGPEVDPVVFTPQEGFDFIVKDLTEAVADLPSTPPSANTLYASKASAHFLLAKLYLNKHIYLGGEAQAADMTKVVEHVDAITAEGYMLHDGYFQIFQPTIETEEIFWTDASVGNRIWNGLHYYQPTDDNTGGGWNGFSTTAEFYALFEGDPDTNEMGSEQEERRGFVARSAVEADYALGYGFLFGQQYNPDGEPLTDRAGRPLAYTKGFPGLAGNTEANGIRVLKYHPTEEYGSFYKHYIFYRYADAYLMKIEAILRGGTSGDDALELFNALRTIRQATPFKAVTLDDVLDERGRELYIEGWRRNDQIRFGTFTQPSELKPTEDGAHVTVFPIPANALTSNPNLVQNSGY